MTCMRIRVARLGAVVLVTSVGIACSGDPETRAREHMSRADSYIAQKQTNEAIIEYRNAVKLKPEWSEAHYKLAKAYMDAADPVKAYGAYSRAADLDPSNVDAQIQSGALLIAAGEFDRARTRAELALKADPDSAMAHILMDNALAG